MIKKNKPFEEKTIAMSVKIWGSRGSLPAPWTPAFVEAHIRSILEDFVDWSRDSSPPNFIDGFLQSRARHRLGGYGGNTSCVEVRSQKKQLIIDGGSGIRPLGYELMQGPCGKGEGELHLLFTHFHWDHLIGLPFFTPFFVPGNKIHLYAVQPDLKSVFQMLFRKPCFPVPLEQLGSNLIYHQLAPRVPVQFGDMTVTPYQLDHPDPCWGFRIESAGKVYSHCVDTECRRLTRKALGPDLPLYQGVDTLLFDGQYTLMETLEKVNWGHATASLGLDIAMREGVRRVVFVHHDPASNEEKIAAAEIQARRYYEEQLKHAQASELHLHPVEWAFGYEGMLLEV